MSCKTSDLCLLMFSRGESRNRLQALKNCRLQDLNVCENIFVHTVRERCELLEDSQLNIRAWCH